MPPEGKSIAGNRFSALARTLILWYNQVYPLKDRSRSVFFRCQNTLRRGEGTKVALSSETLLGFSSLARVEQATGSVGGITYTLDGTPFSVMDAGTKTVYRNGRDDADGTLLFALVHGV